jgi:hypothetical protein
MGLTMPDIKQNLNIKTKSRFWSGGDMCVKPIFRDGKFQKNCKKWLDWIALQCVENR